MSEYSEYKEELDTRLDEVLNRQKSLLSKLGAVQGEITRIKDEIDAEDDKMASAYRDLLNSSDKKTQGLMDRRFELYKKIKKMSPRLSRIILFIYYAIAAICLISTHNFKINAWLIVTLIGLVAIKIPFDLIKKRLIKQHEAILEKPSIKEFDRRFDELSDEAEKKTKELSAELEELTLEESAIKDEYADAKEEERKIRSGIKDLYFNCKYRDTIFFYGMERNNRYELYLDGLLYSTVRGKDLIQIKMTPGLHSFRVKNTCYNFADHSVVYSYDFEAWQFVAGEEPEAHAIVCEFKTLKEYESEEFQGIIKTRLI